jgi:hypothetical protein
MSAELAIGRSCDRVISNWKIAPVGDLAFGKAATPDWEPDNRNHLAIG